MSVTVAKSAGFCFGVNRAVELVEQAAKEGDEVVTLGPIIHNRHAVAHFEEMGVKVIEHPEHAQPGQIVIIRSHGVSKAVYEQLERRGVRIVDATCPFVKRIHGIVSKAEEEGRLPVIIGSGHHPEVEGMVAHIAHAHLLGNDIAGHDIHALGGEIGAVSGFFVDLQANIAGGHHIGSFSNGRIVG